MTLKSFSTLFYHLIDLCCCFFVELFLYTYFSYSFVGPQAWWLGEGLTISHSKKKKNLLRNVTQGIGLL
jgi:hypothetical protein